MDSGGERMTILCMLLVAFVPMVVESETEIESK